MHTLENVLEHLIQHNILSKEVADLTLEINDGAFYENLLTDESLRPTRYLKGLVELSGYQLDFDDENDQYIIKNR